MEPVTFSLVAQAIVTGILLGLVYTLISIGLSLTMGVMGIVNVAHSTFILLEAVCKGLRREMMEDRTDKRAWRGARHGSVPGSKIQEE